MMLDNINPKLGRNEKNLLHAKKDIYVVFKSEKGKALRSKAELIGEAEADAIGLVTLNTTNRIVV